MTKRLKAWMGWFLFLFVLDFLVPFTLLEDHPGLSGSFLFWFIWMLIAVTSMFLIFLQWSEPFDRERQNDE